MRCPATTTPHERGAAAPKKFGTDIHRHTVEFSKNTHTPSPREPTSAALRGNRSSLPTPPDGHKPDALGGISNGPEPYQKIPNRTIRRLRPTSLSRAPAGRVGVRVALTWNKLREEQQDAKSAGQARMSGCFPRWPGVAGPVAASPVPRDARHTWDRNSVRSAAVPENPCRTCAFKEGPQDSEFTRSMTPPSSSMISTNLG